MEFVFQNGASPIFIGNQGENSYLRENILYCDCRLRTYDGGSFGIHKLILSSQSPYFQSLFRIYAISGCTEDCFQIPGISGRMLRQLLDIAYGEGVFITQGNVVQLISAADYLLFPKVVKKCAQFMLNNISTDNCVEYFNTLEHLDLPKYSLECYRFLLARFKDIIMETDTIVNLSFETMKKLLSEDHLFVVNETVVWEAIVQWMKTDSDWIGNDDKNYLLELLHCLRIDELDIEYVSKMIKHYPLLLEHNYHNILMVIISSYQKTDAKNETVQIENKTLTVSRVPQEIVLVLQKNDNNAQHANTIYIFEMFNNLYRFCRKIGCIGNYCFEKYLLIGQQICAIQCSFSDVMIIFDLLDGSVKELPNPGDNLANFSFAEMNGRLFAFRYAFLSFELGISSESSFGVYDPDTCRWTELETMQILHYGIKGVAVNGAVFAAGYNFYSANPMSINLERYDCEANTWTIVSSPIVHRCSFQIASFDGQIYIYGGYNDTLIISLEKYDPNKDTWTQINDIPFTNLPYNFELKVVHGRLIVFPETFAEEEISLSSYQLLRWDEDSSTWLPVDKGEPISVLYNTIAPMGKIIVINDKDLIRKLRYTNNTPFSQLEFQS